jgi:RNA polymerase sigma-70 factor (ECF subfamily)
MIPHYREPVMQVLKGLLVNGVRLEWRGSVEEPPATRHSLIVKLRDPGDAEAWHEFMAIYRPLIFRLAGRKGLQDADADDLCQEVFRAVSGAIGRWNPDPVRGSFRGWLFRIARNLLVNFLSRPVHRPLGSGSPSVQDLLDAQPSKDAAASSLFDAEYRRRVFDWAASEVREAFTPNTWQAFWRTAVEGRSPQAVAVELGLSVGAVYVARSRVLGRLRRRVEALGDDTVALVPEIKHGRSTESL